LTREPRIDLNANAAKGMNATIQFKLSGDNGGEWYVIIKDGKAEVQKGTAPSANMTMSMSASDYVDMTTGKLNGQMAFMSGPRVTPWARSPGNRVGPCSPQRNVGRRDPEWTAGDRSDGKSQGEEVEQINRHERTELDSVPSWAGALHLWERSLARGVEARARRGRRAGS